jgi:hypothetical protein
VPLLFLLGREQKIDGLDVNITVGDNKLYGPTWNTLRDYYRSYKAVTDRDTNPTIQARPAYPAVSDMPYSTHKERWNHSSSRQQMRQSMGKNDPATSTNAAFAAGATHADGADDQSFVRMAGSALCPYLSRLTLQISIEVVDNLDGTYSATWVLVPVVYLHNPYNLTITTNESRFLWSMAGNVLLYNINGGSAKEFLVRDDVTPNTPVWNDQGVGEAQFIIPSSSIKPGEVIAFTPQWGAWGSSVNMQRAGSSIDFSKGGDGLSLPAKQLNGITSATDIFRTLYTTQGWVKFGWEMQNNSGDYDTLSTIMCMDADKMLGFGWRSKGWPAWNQDTLNATRSWNVSELVGVRTPITTFDIYVKPVDLVYPASNNPDLKALAFPSFIASNPLSSGEDRFSADTQGSVFVSPMRNGYVADGTMDTQIISLGLNGQGQGYWGLGIDYGSSLTPVLDVPTAPIHSLGHLQHANLLDQPHYPALAIGNSFTSPFLQNNASLFHTFWKNYQQYNEAWGRKCFYDLSYLANQALWDDFYFSTIAPDQTDSSYNDPSPNTAGNVGDMLDAVLAGQRTLHNSRMQIHKDASEATSTTKALLSDYKTSASRLMVNGAFNINSTSVAAWRAFLAGLKDADIQRSNQGSLVADKISDNAAFLRHGIPNGSAVTNGAYTDQSSWTGFRALSESELDALAKAIVDEIKLRALELGDNGNPSPFGSLSNFVNRMPYAVAAEYTRLGLLQAAINKAGLNDRFNSATEFDTTNWNSSKSDIMHSSNNNWNQNNRADFANPDCRINTAATASTYLLQSDILQQIAPYISTRSDTFKIRSYGEHLDPITGEPEGKAWLEAVVQRSPVPVKPSASNPQEPETPNSMGRKFEIVSLRWLSQEDI